MPRRRKVELLGAVLLALLAPTYSACGAGLGARRGSPDADRDGMADAADDCPVVPEDVDGFEDTDGCPEGQDHDADRDGDGVADHADACPDDAEDPDGFAGDDGCPEPDNDDDRVLDAQDRCPCVPEDHDGFEDSDGCPDPDNDGDRRPDRCDACPSEPETYNGHCDDDGCPDVGHLCVEGSRVVMVDRVLFDHGTAEVPERSYAAIEALTTTLLTNPQIGRVALVGHADAREPGAGPLAVARAEAVRNALVQRGVTADRIQPEGSPPERGRGLGDGARRVSVVVHELDGRPVVDPQEPSSEALERTCVPTTCRDQSFCEPEPPAPPRC